MLIASPARISASGFTRACTRTILLPSRSTASMPWNMRLRCRSSSWNALTIFMPCDVSRIARDDGGDGEVLALGDFPDPPDELAKRDCHDGAAAEADRRHQRILRDHHYDEPDQRQKVAAQAHRDDVHHLACGICALRDPRYQIAGREPLIGRDVHRQNVVEHALLHFRHEPIADARQRDFLVVGRNALDRENCHDRYRQPE